jgi:flagellar hook assembly protein FlgD
MYTNGSTAIDYYPTFIPVILDPEVNVEEAGTGNSCKVDHLTQPEPNPFRENTSISFGITKDEHVDLRIYDTVGRTIRTLVNDARGAGTYTVTWDGKSDSGQELSPGIYFVKLTTEAFSSARKVVLR